MLKKLLSIISPRDEAAVRAQIYRTTLQEEAKLGGALFGPIPVGTRREFFCLDEHTWVWHEEWTDVNSIRQARTTRYDVRPHGILKAQDGQPYQKLGYDETMRLLEAARRYGQIMNERYTFAA